MNAARVTLCGSPVAIGGLVLRQISEAAAELVILEAGATRNVVALRRELVVDQDQPRVNVYELLEAGPGGRSDALAALPAVQDVDGFRDVVVRAAGKVWPGLTGEDPRHLVAEAHELATAILEELTTPGSLPAVVLPVVDAQLLEDVQPAIEG